MKKVFAFAIAVTLACSLMLAQSSRTEVEFKAAQHKEQVVGDFKGAIDQYKRIAQGKDRAFAAKALLRMAALYQKLGDAEAHKVYERIAREFADQKDAATEARTRLSALGGTQLKSPQVPTEYFGVWNGTGVQDDGSSWQFTISVAGGVGPITGTINYLALDCGGELTLRSVLPDSIELSEKLTYGTNRCVNNGRVTLRLEQNGTLKYGWRKGGFPGTATATLNRVVSETETPVRLGWFDRAGDALSTLGNAGAYRGVELSPDGKRLAVHRHSGEGGDIFIVELTSGAMSRLTVDVDGQQDNSSPIWSPDGSQIVFGSYRNGKWGLYRKRADALGKEELLFESELPKMPMSWAPDGKSIVYWVRHPETISDEWILPLTGDRKPFPFLQSRFNENHAQMSPDGKWIAYFGNEDGQGVYVRPFPSGEGRWKVSSGPGVFPRWRGDGKELYFLSTGNNGIVMAVDVRVVGSSIEAGVPHALFDSGYTNFNHENANYHTFAVSADGQKFLIPRPVPAAASSR